MQVEKVGDVHVGNTEGIGFTDIAAGRLVVNLYALDLLSKKIRTG